jgi:hypothetical protein
MPPELITVSALANRLGIHPDALVSFAPTVGIPLFSRDGVLCADEAVATAVLNAKGYSVPASRPRTVGRNRAAARLGFAATNPVEIEADEVADEDDDADDQEDDAEADAEADADEDDADVQVAPPRRPRNRRRN